MSSALLASTALSSRAPLRMRHPDFTKAGADAVESDSDDSLVASDSEGDHTAVDEAVIEDNYVRKVLAKEKPLPPITLRSLWKEINVVSTLALTVVPALAFYGAMNVKLQWQTALWSVVYYFFTGLGITAGEFSLSSPTFSRRRTHDRISIRLPSTLVPPILHRLATPPVLPRPRRIRRRRRID